MGELIVGWRLLCHDCNGDTDLHQCFIDDQEDGDALRLCGECLNKRGSEEMLKKNEVENENKRQ